MTAPGVWTDAEVDYIKANPAPYDSKVAIEVTEDVGREIIRRWLNSQPPSLWSHHGTRFAD